MRVNFKYREGDIVFAHFIPDVPLEVTGLHRLNGGNSYTCFDGENEQVKYEYQLFAKEKSKRKIGYKRHDFSKQKSSEKHTSVRNIGDISPLYVPDD